MPARSMAGRRIDGAQKPARRLSPELRRQQIVDGAIAFFSEVGFDGGTRQLAERLGIAQPLLYRYFPAKDDLARAVYETLFTGRWQAEWADIISDRDTPLRDRLIAFYRRYAEIIFDPEWVRIYLFAGLKDLDINRWWTRFVDENVLRRVCAEIREESGLPGLDEFPITPEETEAFWLFHGGIFYHGVRREVYRVGAELDGERFIELAVDALLAGLPSVARQALAKTKKTGHQGKRTGGRETIRKKKNHGRQS